MHLSFIGLVIGTVHLNLSHSNFSLFAKKRKSQRENIVDSTQGLSNFRFKSYRTISLDLEGSPEITSDSDAFARFNEECRRSGIIQTFLKKPTRHYPAHHYKRKIKQRKGFQQTEARAELYIEKHAYIKPHNNIKYASIRHIPRIIEAIKQFKAWKANAPRNKGL
ncbi:conserved hypothetical protein [Theileria equi strain WA]|uniref:Uncharacterized protein n=1 Tax=Theileria equi strain WA TaxID=1537102 RepID=L1LBM6_THEEQ|nr:conserved hypothetical protein [Theileria equi strain WA]EKX72674.1 conserved hypothetical protein [Theileria equi strain WA]|eukprot:XP_004832126.1 conserved hypothetical protein [Theileria equi strain WA]